MMQYTGTNSSAVAPYPMESMTRMTNDDEKEKEVETDPGWIIPGTMSNDADVEQNCAEPVGDDSVFVDVDSMEEDNKWTLESGVPGPNAMNPEWAVWAASYWAERPTEQHASWGYQGWLAWFNQHYPELREGQQ